MQAPTVPSQKSEITGNYRKLPEITGNYRKLPEITGNFLTVGGGLLSKLSLGFKPLVIFKACTAKEMQAEKRPLWLGQVVVVTGDLLFKINQSLCFTFLYFGNVMCEISQGK